MSWYDDYWSGVKSAIAAAWPEVPAGNVWSDVSAQKRDWPNLISSGQIAAPWVVAKIDDTPSDEGPINFPTFEVVTTVFYIAADNAAPEGQRIVPFVFDRLLTLKGVIRGGTLVPGTVMDTWTVNTNADNPIDLNLLSTDARYTAGSLEFTTHVTDVS